MTNTIQQLKEGIMAETMRQLWHETNCPAHSTNMRSEDKCNCSYSAFLELLPTALDKVIKATADAMVGEVETLTHYYRSKFSSDMSRNETYEERNAQMLLKEDVISIITRIAEEKALRDEITQ